MKKIIYLSLILIGTFGCTKDSFQEEINTSSSDSSLTEDDGSSLAHNNTSLVIRQEGMFNVKSAYIDNGLQTSSSSNNILIFSSIEHYNETIDELDNLYENHNDSFEDMSDPELSDEEYEALAESTNFNEDQLLMKINR